MNNNASNKATFCIYLLENNINHKKYVGQTIRSPKVRWRNGNGYIHQQVIGNAIQKYGWDNFTHTILEDNILTQEEADEREKYYIAFYNCYAFNNEGYNVAEGGHNGYPLFGKTDEEKRLYAEKQRLIARQRFEDNPNLKEKMSQISKEYWTQENKDKKSTQMKIHYQEDPQARERLIEYGQKMINDKKIPVVCVETGELFESLTAAGNWCNILGTNISLYLQGKSRYAGFHPDTKQRLHWCHPEDNLEEVRKKIYNIICVETQDRFETAEEASKAYKVDPSALCKHLNHPDVYKSCGKHPETKAKLHWIRDGEK